jgi:hypothetical protein
MDVEALFRVAREYIDAGKTAKWMVSRYPKETSHPPGGSFNRLLWGSEFNKTVTISLLRHDNP